MAIRLSIKDDVLYAFQKKELVGTLPIEEANKFKKKDLRVVFEKVAECVNAAWTERNGHSVKHSGWFLTKVERETNVLNPPITYLQFVPDDGHLPDKELFKEVDDALLGYRNAFAREKLAKLKP